MKICFLTARFPFPQYGGGALRINEIARYLKSQGHELVLVSLLDNSTPELEEDEELPPPNSTPLSFTVLSTISLFELSQCAE